MQLRLGIRCQVLATITSLWIVATSAFANESVDYARDIKPILQDKCFACHGALKQEANLRLDTVAFIRKGGDSGSTVSPDKAAESLLLVRVSAKDESERMPLQATPLTAEQIQKVQKWIEQGATGPANEQPEKDPRDHWAFRVPQRGPLPEASLAEFSQHPIDRFIAAEYRNRGLTPGPLAAREVLLRRVYLDLIGLPPSPAEIDAFVRDSSPTAYDRVVDKLLNSPQYGERWARHWMDVWRYADWHGRRHVPDVWNSAPQIWRWRDWIVRSLNEDVGYNQMIGDMLAADEIAPDDDDRTVATGYLIRNWYALNPNDWMRQNVEHTAKAFLGLTFNCAHCHDHKYDPISQRDYFALRAFFEPIGIRQDRLPGEPDPGPFQEYSYSVLRKIVRTGMVKIYDKTPDAPTWFYTGGDERNRVKEEGTIPPSVPAIFGSDAIKIEPVNLSVPAYYPGLRPNLVSNLRKELEHVVAQRRTERDAARKQALQSDTELQAKFNSDPEDVLVRQAIDANQARVVASELRVAAADAELASFEARVAADSAKFGMTPAVDAESLAKHAHQLEAAAAIAKAEAEIAAATQAIAEYEANPQNSMDAEKTKAVDAVRKQLTDANAALALARKNQADPAMATQYTSLGPQYPAQSTGRRRALAEWLGSRTNPLTARVAVNHIWMRHFHAPLVPTVFDFGRNGKSPSHPELLDWLAVEFMDSGWRIKHLHRLIVTSRTYQLSSTVGDNVESANLDPENNYLWRQNVGRLEAEVVRDSVLMCAGRLDFRMGGQELENTEALTTRRRSLYYSCQPEFDGKSEFGALFDAPDPLDCYRRTKSIIPQQALALSNSALVHEVSSEAAEQLWGQLAPTERNATGLVRAAFFRILGRAPSDSELVKCLEYFASRTEKSKVPLDADSAGRAALVRVLLNHNDFISIR